MEIRQLHTDELPELQSFIYKYWKKDHILSSSKQLMDYQHLGEDGYHWIIARDEDGIQVILGFVPTNQYDPSIRRRDIWLCIWMRSDKELPKGTGTKLLDYLEEWYKPDTIGAIGINDKIEQLYLKRGWKSGTLNHYVFISPGPLAKYKESKTFRPDYVDVYDTIPEKSLQYVVNRYYNHPWYNYHSYSLGEFCIVTRRIEVNGGACLRIVECFTKSEEALDFCTPHALHELCVREGVDYIDMVTNRDHVPKGLTLKPDGLILPNWFEPFTQEDKPIKYAHNGGRLYEIHKGDADQDRPSII